MLLARLAFGPLFPDPGLHWLRAFPSTTNGGIFGFGRLTTKAHPFALALSLNDDEERERNKKQHIAGSGANSLASELSSALLGSPLSGSAFPYVNGVAAAADTHRVAATH